MTHDGPVQNGAAGTEPARGQTPRKRTAYKLRMKLEKIALEAKLATRRMGGERLRPSVFVIGVQKSGTTSLYGHLARHPEVIAPLVKEVHYFDVATHRGEGWYAGHFPSLAEAKARSDASGRPTLTFDTSPYYMFHPDVTARIKAYDPDAKIIAVLRDPVGRAWSHYWHEWSRGYEPLPPLEALTAEATRLPDPHHHVGSTAAEKIAHQHHSYCARSEYDLQLARWKEAFPPEQILCLKSEALFQDPARSLEQVSTFLGISPFANVSAKALNPGRYETPPPEAQEWLRERLAPSKAAIRAMLGDEFIWD